MNQKWIRLKDDRELDDPRSWTILNDPERSLTMSNDRLERKVETF